MNAVNEEKSANAGELGEVYVFFSLLGNPVLYLCDAELHRLEDSPGMPVKQIIRGKGKPDCLVCEALENKEWRLSVRNVRKIISRAQYAEKAGYILECLKRGEECKADKASILKECTGVVRKCIRELGTDSLKADSVSKEDIVLKLLDVRLGREPELGFSIKSHMGGAPTLLNANKDSTAFRYRLDISDQVCEEVRQFEGKPKKLISEILSRGGNIGFDEACGETMRENLQFIDSGMSDILGECLLTYYAADRVSKISAICDRMLDENKHKLPPAKIFKYKMKKLLEASALGMTPSTPWEGEESANGGFIIVRKDGEIVSYLVYDRKDLLEYLFNYTKFETPSCSRHGYGKIEHDDRGYYTKLGLQIRFV